MNTTTISVGLIHCASCERTISTVLGRIDGVSLVRPDAATNQVRVRYDDARVSAEQLRAALVEIGYQPTD